MTKRTRAKKIEAICAAMENWDQDTLVHFAQDMRKERLKLLTHKELEEVYQDDVVGPPERVAR